MNLCIIIVEESVVVSLCPLFQNWAVWKVFDGLQPIDVYSILTQKKKMQIILYLKWLFWK